MWILMLLEAATTSNESNKNPIPIIKNRETSHLIDGEQNLWNVPSLIMTLFIRRKRGHKFNENGGNPYPDTNPQTLRFDTQTCENDQTDPEKQ